MNIAIDRAEITKGIMLGKAEPAYTFIDSKALDFAELTKGIIKEDAERAKKLLDEAGRKVGADGVRERTAPSSRRGCCSRRSPTSCACRRQSRATCQDRRRPEDRRLRLDDRAGRDGQTGSRSLDGHLPLHVGRRLLNLDFDSKNMPAPNRMNWNDPQTDELAEERARRR